MLLCLSLVTRHVMLYSREVDRIEDINIFAEQAVVAMVDFKVLNACYAT
jgi:hypothetical protein